MKITQCPQCGGNVISESVGWRCESCQGFIDMQGGFHPHKEEPFMPPMTYADRIRASSDEQLALFFKELMFNDFKPACKNRHSSPQSTSLNVRRIAYRAF